MEKNKPIHKIRYGAVVASIWENKGKGGVAFASVTVERLYKDDEDSWKSTGSLSRTDLPNAVKALDEAHTFLTRERDEE
jgi:hypothetical protein